MGKKQKENIIRKKDSKSMILSYVFRRKNLMSFFGEWLISKKKMNLLTKKLIKKKKKKNRNNEVIPIFAAYH